MRTEVIVGPAASVEAALFEEIQRLRNQDSLAPIHIVVPSNILAVSLRRRLASELGGAFNVRLATFIEVVKLLAGPGDKPLAGDSERLAAIRRAVVGRSGYFESVARQPGLHRALLATLRDLENAGVGIAELEWQAAAYEGSNSASAGDASRLRALASIYDRASNSLGTVFESPSQLFERALIRDAPQSILGTSNIIIFGFHDFTQIQLDVLRGIGRQLDVIVFLADELSGASAYTARTLQGLLDHGFAVRAPAVDPAARQTMAARLFASADATDQRLDEQAASAAARDSSALIDFISAPGQRSEAREAVRRVVGLIEDGVSPDDIALVYRGDPYPGILGETLTHAGVKYFLAGGRKASETRYGKSVLLLLRLVDSELRRSDVIEFATFAPLRSEALQGASPGGWEWLTRKAAVLQGADQWRQRIKTFADQLAGRSARMEEPPARVDWRVTEAERVLSFVERLFADLEKLSASRSFASQAVLLKELLSYYIDPAEGDIACLDAIDQLGRLEAIAPDESFDVFREALELQLDSVALQIGRVGRGHVFLGQPRDVRGLRFAHVLVLGLAERSFPPPVRSDSLLLDKERSRINRALPRTVLALDEERLLFSLIVGSARHLYASYPRQDEDRPRPRFASPFFLALAEAAYGGQFDWRLENLPLLVIPQLQPSPTLAPSEALWAEEYDLAVLRSIPDRSLTLTYLESVSDHFADMRAASACRNVAEGLTRYDGYIQDSAGRDRLSAFLRDRLLSASALQTYAECPQRFFLSYLLDVEALDEPESIIELSPLDRGEIIHSILERFYRGLKHRGELPLVPGGRQRYELYVELLAAEAADEFASAEARGVTGLLVAWKAHRRVLREDLVAFLDQELERASADFVPTEFEYSFGYADDPAPPVELPAGGDLTLRLRGKIDRVDLGKGRARVIDYKSGRSKASKNKDSGDVSLAGGRQLQLPIYLLAAAQAFGLDVAGVDASYFHINRDVREPLTLSGAALQVRRGDFDDILAVIGDSMRAGLFPPRTSPAQVSGKRENCAFCDYKFVCPARVAIQEDRKQGDPSLATLHRLKDIE